MIRNIYKLYFLQKLSVLDSLRLNFVYLKNFERKISTKDLDFSKADAVIAQCQIRFDDLSYTLSKILIC